jgi:hypothetical protein
MERTAGTGWQHLLSRAFRCHHQVIQRLTAQLQVDEGDVIGDVADFEMVTNALKTQLRERLFGCIARLFGRTNSLIRERIASCSTLLFSVCH